MAHRVHILNFSFENSSLKLNKNHIKQLVKIFYRDFSMLGLLERSSVVSFFSKILAKPHFMY